MITTRTLSFPDHSQNYWHLACIGSASQTIFSFLIGGVLAKQYGAKAAFASICVGNLLLWLIGLGVVFMALRGRKTGIQVASNYLTPPAGVLAAVVVTSAFTFGTAEELKSIGQIMTHYTSSSTLLGWILFALGIGTSWLAMGGIRIIKRVSIWSLPLLFIIIGLALCFYGKAPPESQWSLPIAGVMTVLMSSLAGIVNIPAFFRHSHSKVDSVLGLSLMTLLVILLQSPAIFLNISLPTEIFLSPSLLFSFFVFLLLLISLTCINLTNIYFISVCIEMLFPRHRGAWNYFWIGVAGTLAYSFYRKSALVDAIETVSNNCMANLGVILLFLFIARIIIIKPLGRGHKTSYLVCWLVGCIATLITQIQNPQDPNASFSAGLWISLLAFLSVFFVRYLNRILTTIEMDL